MGTAALRSHTVATCVLFKNRSPLPPSILHLSDLTRDMRQRVITAYMPYTLLTITKCLGSRLCQGMCHCATYYHSLLPLPAES